VAPSATIPRIRISLIPPTGRHPSATCGRGRYWTRESRPERLAISRGVHNLKLHESSRRRDQRRGHEGHLTRSIFSPAAWSGGV